MSVFIEVADIIRQQLDQPEYWSEYGLPISIEIAPRMTDTDWRNLRESWSSESPAWQYRAANLAAYGNPDIVIPMLLEKLHDSNSNVFVRIMESLGEFSPDQVKSYLKAKDREMIMRANITFIGIDKSVIDSLLRYLQI